MSILIVGGDRLGNIPAKLKSCGFEEINHITGRKKGHMFIDLPGQVDVILLLTDYINHGMAVQIKEKARERSIKTIFARRSWSHIANALATEGLN